jgi:hypothetical protein
VADETMPLYAIHKGERHLMGHVKITNNGNDIEAIIYDRPKKVVEEPKTE